MATKKSNAFGFKATEETLRILHCLGIINEKKQAKGLNNFLNRLIINFAKNHQSLGLKKRMLLFHLTQLDEKRESLDVEAQKIADEIRKIKIIEEEKKLEGL
jgi:hypothetical protein